MRLCLSVCPCVCVSVCLYPARVCYFRRDFSRFAFALLQFVLCSQAYAESGVTSEVLLGWENNAQENHLMVEELLLQDTTVAKHFPGTCTKRPSNQLLRWDAGITADRMHGMQCAVRFASCFCLQMHAREIQRCLTSLVVWRTTTSAVPAPILSSSMCVRESVRVNVWESVRDSTCVCARERDRACVCTSVRRFSHLIPFTGPPVCIVWPLRFGFRATPLVFYKHHTQRHANTRRFCLGLPIPADSTSASTTRTATKARGGASGLWTTSTLHKHRA